MARLKVKPQTENANKHSPYGLGLLETSIGRDGWIDAITVAADDESISGSARIETGAAKGWNFAHEEPVVVKAPSDRPIIVETDGSQPLIHRRVDIPTASDPRARRLSVAANQITAADWVPDASVLAGWAESDESIKGLFTDDSWSALLEQAGTDILGGATQHGIVGHSEGYDFRDIHAGKLAYRIEAAWRSHGALAIDLYSGQGQLAAWYQRRFERVVRVDQEEQEGLDFVSDAEAWLRGADFAAFASDFDFIDFDDEGSPLRAVKALFDVLPSRDKPFVLCITDGSGLNLKLHGVFDPALYGLPGSKRRATTKDYEGLDELVRGAVEAFAARGPYTAQQWSSVRGSEGNVTYQTFRIMPTGAE